ncbi:hypothetical protein BMH32_05850 [Leucobacter sp. OLJS4]|nr:hypothetical protein BMH32_05850 [Leucobacter sp. OLJS4]
MDSKRPTLTGTGQPGASVEVKDQEGKSLGSATVAEDGTWSLTPTSDLAKGPNELTAVQTPKDGGDTSEATATITVNMVDQLAVSGPTAGSTVNTDTPVVTGTSEPKADITITDKDGTVIGSTTANGKGEWTVTLPAQPNGTVEITVTDEHGQKRDHSFTVDVAAAIAELVITGPKEGATVDTDTPKVTGTAQPGAKVTVTGKDGETLAETTAGEDGKWAVDLPKLPNGTHEITVTDEHGKSDDVSFVVNAIAPIQFTGPEASESKRPAVTGTGHPGSNIELKDVLGKTIGIGVVAADGKWSITPTQDLAKGTNVVTAHQTAPGGKTSTATGTIQVTAKDPLVVTGPTPGATVESETPTVSGTAEPGAKITVTGPDGKLGETVADENGDWTLTLPKQPEGDLSITVTDEHGGKEEIDFTVKPAAPAGPDADSQADPNTGANGAGSEASTATNPNASSNTNGASSNTNSGANGTDEDSKDSNTNSASEQDARANMNASASAAASANADGQGNAKIEGAAQAAAFSDATAIASAAADVSAKAAAQAAALATASTNASANIDANASAAASGAAIGSADSNTQAASNASASAAAESNASASAKSAATTTSSSNAGSQAAGQASAAGATSNTQGANSGSDSNDRANANAAASAAATAKADDNSNASVKGAAEAAAYADNTAQASAAADISAEAAAKAAATPTASSDTTANLTSASNTAAEAAAAAAANADNSSNANAGASQRATTNANAASQSAAITNASSNAGANAGSTSTGKPKWKRLGGANRYETAVKVSKDSYPRGAKSVVIARSDLAPDALSAAPFAVKQNAPVLLTPPTSLVKDTKAEIKRLGADTVYIAGGTGAISAAVEAEIRGMGVKIVRMAGSDRYATSVKIAQTGWKNGSEKAFVATGRDYPDALSAGSAAGATGVPVILVDGVQKNLNAAAKSTLAKYGTKHLYIAGGNGAVSTGIESTMRSGGKTVERFAGATRYETSAAIAKQWHTKGGLVYLATGVDFPDALAGSAVAGAQDAPIMLTMKNCVPKPVKDTITGTIKPQAGVVLGGTGVISDRVLNTQPSC